MMSFLKRYKNEILILTLLIITFLATRLYQLGYLQIFTDEAIYIRWAQIAKQDPSWRYISLTDGKQPSFIWLMMGSLKFFDDPLIAGRMVSVFAGLGTVIGLFLLGKELFKSSNTGLASAALYVVYPMAIIYDRMALYDSLVGMCTVWSLYVTVLLVRYVRLDIGLILGMIMGFGVITKSNAFFSVYLLPFSLMLFDWKRKDRRGRFYQWIFFASIATVMTYIMYNALRLFPFFYMIDEKNQVFVHPFSEWIRHPLAYVSSNLLGLIDWFVVYFSVPFIMLVVAAFLVDRKAFFEKVLLICWFLAPFTALALFGKNIYPRYILFMTLPLLPLVAYTLIKLENYAKNKLIYAALLLGILGMPLRADYLILTDIARAPIPKLDKDQYVTEWPAGGGVRETVAFLEERAKHGKVFVATAGTFGLMPYALEIYLKDNPNITIFGFWPVGRPPVEILTESKNGVQTYVLFYQPCPTCPDSGTPPDNWPIRQVLEYKKSPTARLGLYQVMP